MKAFLSHDTDIYKNQEAIKNQVSLLALKPKGEKGIDTPLFKTTVILPIEHSLGLETIMAILKHSSPSDFFIGGTVEETTQTLNLIRGDLSTLVVPFSAFKTSGDRIKPNFKKMRVIDSGLTVQLGKYEAATNALLYEFDPVYRKKKKLNELNTSSSFGSCLKRLRLQKGLSQEQFGTVSAKQIGRIENSNKKPRSSTIDKIAKALGVLPEEITTY